MTNHTNENVHEHEHDHDHDEFQTITLTMEDDTELECIVIGVFEFEEKDYIALSAISEENEESDILIYAYHELDDEEIELEFIEDEEYFNKVADEFERIFDEIEE